MPNKPLNLPDGELLTILRTYGEVSFHCDPYEQMNMCRVKGYPLRVGTYDRAHGGYMCADIVSTRTAFVELYLTVQVMVSKIEGDKRAS